MRDVNAPIPFQNFMRDVNAPIPFPTRYASGVAGVRGRR